MQIADFQLECFFGQYEFTAPYLLAQSDCESMPTRELLALEPGAQEAYLDLCLGYTETWGDPQLRSLVAQLYRGATTDDILMFHGAQEAIFALANVALQAGDHLIAQWPNYQSAYSVAQAIPGVEVSFWRQRDEGDRWTCDFEELEALIRPNTRMIAINTPNNPTCYTFTNAELARLAAICDERGILLFADEVYKGLELDDEPRLWTADCSPTAVSLGVMSKSYGLAGLRVGWLASHDHELLDRCVRFKHYLSICDSAPSEFLARVALLHGPYLLERSTRLIRENIALADAFFSRHQDLFVPHPAPAGPVAFHRWCGPGTVDDFCQRLVDEAGVLLMPARVYEMDAPYFRMGYGRAGVPLALQKLEEWLSAK